MVYLIHVIFLHQPSFQYALSYTLYFAPISLFLKFRESTTPQSLKLCLLLCMLLFYYKVDNKKVFGLIPMAVKFLADPLNPVRLVSYLVKTGLFQLCPQFWHLALL